MKKKCKEKKTGKFSHKLQLQEQLQEQQQQEEETLGQPDGK